MILKDLLREDLKVVFCGTAPSKKSYEQGAYYAHPANRFYKTLYEVGFTDKLLKPSEYKSLISYGIGLTDLNKKEYGSDKSLSIDCFDAVALDKKIKKYKPTFLAFTSKTAGKIYFKTKNISYGESEESPGNTENAQNKMSGTNTRIYVLPSTSPLAITYWDISYWKELAKEIRVLKKAYETKAR